jgi:molybdenum cofactor cytidylyltransferase
MCCLRWEGCELTNGLILAGGEGSRFGSDSKLLADLGGRPLLEWAVRAQCSVGSIDRVVVVLGARADVVAAGVDFGRAEVVVCDEWKRGQSASLRRGLEELVGSERIVVTLGDAPLVSSEVISRFALQEPGTRAVYAGSPGHPVVLGPGHVSRLMSGQGDRGARDLLRGAVEIEVGHLCSGRDVDTPDDLEAIRDEARAII